MRSLFTLLAFLLVFTGCDDAVRPTPTDSGATDSGATDSGGGDAGTDSSVSRDSSVSPDSSVPPDTSVPCPDDDMDGVCNDIDMCEGVDDTLDADGDGTPDGCDCDAGPTCDTNATCAEFATGAVCTCNSGYTGDGATCALVDCGALTAPTDGSVMTPSGTTVGETGTYGCDTGHMLTGDTTRMCQADGSWSGTAPTCVIVDCGALSAPVNGSVMASVTTHSASATYACDTGYMLNGAATRDCLPTGAWSGTAPTCDPATGLTPGLPGTAVAVGGWSARCMAWTGNLCTHMQAMVACSVCATYPSCGVWHDITPYNNGSMRTSRNWCAIATGGDETVISQGMGAPGSAMAPHGCGYSTGAHPECTGTRASFVAPGVTEPMLGLNLEPSYCNSTTALLNVECAW